MRIVDQTLCAFGGEVVGGLALAVQRRHPGLAVWAEPDREPAIGELTVDLELGCRAGDGWGPRGQGASGSH